MLIIHCCVRSFTTSICSNAKSSAVIKKIMGATQKKKKVYAEAMLPSVKAFSKGTNEGRHSGQARRASVLNKLFMKNITDLLATGEQASTFAHHGIEIHKVQIAPDYKGLNVFWTSTKQDDSEIEQLLKKNAGFLRHELSSLRVMGNVPRIHFVKDKHTAVVKEVEFRLSIADFGEDHEPLERLEELKTELELLTPLAPNIQDKVLDLDNEDDVENTSQDNESFPPMPQNVLELNHSDILQRIKNKMSKSQARHRSNIESVWIPEKNENPIEFPSAKARKEALKNFIREREVLRAKQRRMENRAFNENISEEIENNSEPYYVLEEEESDYVYDETADKPN